MRGRGGRGGGGRGGFRWGGGRAGRRGGGGHDGAASANPSTYKPTVPHKLSKELGLGGSAGRKATDGGAEGGAGDNASGGSNAAPATLMQGNGADGVDQAGPGKRRTSFKRPPYRLRPQTAITLLVSCKQTAVGCCNIKYSSASGQEVDARGRCILGNMSAMRGVVGSPALSGSR